MIIIYKFWLVPIRQRLHNRLNVRTVFWGVSIKIPMQGKGGHATLSFTHPRAEERSAWLNELIINFFNLVEKKVFSD